MYSGGYGFGNAAPNFSSPSPHQQQGQQPQHQPGQQMMYNQQQFAGMTPQGGFNPNANPQMMQAGASAMMQNAGMPGMAPNGQSEWSRLDWPSQADVAMQWPTTSSNLPTSTVRSCRLRWLLKTSLRTTT
jgi:hypothetical protein